MKTISSELTSVLPLKEPTKLSKEFCKKYNLPKNSLPNPLSIEWINFMREKK